MKKKILIFILIILILINVSIYIFSLKRNDIVIIGSNNSTIIYYKNNKISKIKYEYALSNKYKFENYKFYKDNNYVSGYLNFEYMDGRNIPILYNDYYEKEYMSTLIAVKGEIEPKVLKTKTIFEPTENDKKILKNVLLKNHLDDNYTYFSKTFLYDDLNLYIVNNYSVNGSDYYCIAFIMNSSNQISILELEKYNQNITSKTILFSELIDIDLDNQYEILIRTFDGDNTPSYYKFYKYNSESNKIEELK